MSSQNNPSKSTNVTSHNIIVGANNDDLRVVKAALAEDPSCINFQDTNTGLTAIHIAAAHGTLRLARYLLEQNGIDLSLADWRGRRAVDLAIAIGHKPLINLLARRMYPTSFEEDSNDAAIKNSGPEPS